MNNNVQSSASRLFMFLFLRVNRPYYRYMQRVNFSLFVVRALSDERVARSVKPNHRHLRYRVFSSSILSIRTQLHSESDEQLILLELNLWMKHNKTPQ